MPRLSLLILLVWLPLLEAATPVPLVFRCSPDNDLFRAATARGVRYPRYDSPAEAVERAPRGSGVLILADEYPAKPTPLSAALFTQAKEKHLRLYVEYPSVVPDVDLGTAREVHWERAVISSDAFSPGVPRLRILGLHRVSFLPVSAQPADIVIARVAGFDTAVYGLPDKEVYPILFEHDGALIATTKLSQFVAARYAPSDVWEPIWSTILSRLAGTSMRGALSWTPVVRPTYSPAERLPKDAEARAFRRGVAAFGNARLYVDSSWEPEVVRRGKINDSVHPMPSQAWRVGDGSRGLLEGFSSSILPDGSQPIRWARRADCIGEASFALALAGLLGDRAVRDTAANLNNYLYFNSELAAGVRADPKNSNYGLLQWFTPSEMGIYYGDDNARALLGTIGAAAALKTNRWDEAVLRALLANLRTTGKLGFRGNSLNERDLEKNGWRQYWEGSRTNFRPHYESYLWACYLWAYHKTGYRPFLDRAKSAIRLTVEAYPDQWRWANGLQQERARMLLPLAWLVRVEDTPEHRAWLRKFAAELLQSQHVSGAIGEQLGGRGMGSYGPPASNEEYGLKEATLMQRNGDPVADMLYTMNFAFLGLHEAAAATGDVYYANAVDRMAQFFCRIQVQSQTHPEFDGWWFRAFEFNRWEYWASNADAGWGAWSTESGWTQSWIVSVLGMRQAGTSLWALTRDSQIARHLKDLQPVMIPEQ